MRVRITLRENFVLPPGAKLREDVAALGLDPELYIAVIECDFGVAGIINMNRRVYPVADFRSENAALAARIKAGENGVDLVDAEEDHPDWNPTFKVPLAIVELRVDEDEAHPGKAAISRGRVAFLNTTHGRDMLVLYKAGLRIGFSSRGTGWCEDHLVDESSPYWDANEAYRNSWVGEVRGWKLETYDAVRIPSAGTFAKKSKEHRETADAYARLVEAGYVKEETTMTLAELKQKYPALFEEIFNEGKAANAAGVALTEAQSKCRALETQVSEAKTACEAEKAKVTTSEGKAVEAERKLGEATTALTEAKAALKVAEDAKKEAEGKLAQREHTDGVALAVVKAVESAPEEHRPTVEAQLKLWIEASPTATVEQVTKTGELFAKMAKDVAEKTAAKTAGTAPTEAGDDPSKPKTEGGKPAPADPKTESVEMVSLGLAIQRARGSIGIQ